MRYGHMVHKLGGIELDFILRPDGLYELRQPIVYYSPRYRKTVTVPSGMLSDGATGAEDIVSVGWWVHDKVCDEPYFDDGTPCSRWQGSMILGDILAREGRWFRRITWPIATFAAGLFARSDEPPRLGFA